MGCPSLTRSECDVVFKVHETRDERICPFQSSPFHIYQLLNSALRISAVIYFFLKKNFLKFFSILVWISPNTFLFVVLNNMQIFLAIPPNTYNAFCMLFSLAYVFYAYFHLYMNFRKHRLVQELHHKIQKSVQFRRMAMF